MPATERATQTFVDSLQPAPTADQTCPLCLESYPADQGPELDPQGDYPARTRTPRQGMQCQHVFGRLCIERHVRSGQSYGNRCPMCRERWFGTSGDDATQPQHRPRAREVWDLDEATEPRPRRGAIDGGMFSVIRARLTGVRNPQDTQTMSATGRLHRAVAILERAIQIHDLQDLSLVSAWHLSSHGTLWTASPRDSQSLAYSLCCVYNRSM
ncbi:hypothetical protein CC86DRAFT_421961 [Ophiobolus disseminans]|uniref:RING-type domain-containing protein n=1 Tax=Ophiobolus disseminans TaxID=1469910 RepID=A0A6A6ZQZ8_9PLEO|nr:hypothetical protein CC86DRAFT_421961 [Ophiobolus disseminans]